MNRRKFIHHLSQMTTASALGSSAFSVNATYTAPTKTRFAVIGDCPYYPFEEIQVQRMIVRLNELNLDFVIHLGDIKAAKALCTQALLDSRAELFSQLQAPLIYTPGDNDWADCRRPARLSNNEVDPLKAKQMLLQTWFGESGWVEKKSIARRADSRLAIERQPQQIENARWQHGHTLFVLLHTIGSNDNAGFDVENDREQQVRATNNLAWLDACFKQAKHSGVKQIAIGFHASINLNNPPKAYKPLIDSIRSGTMTLRKPLLLMHGDTHTQRIDQPFFDNTSNNKRISSITRLECFGSGIVNYVLVEPTNDSARAWRFTIGDMPGIYANEAG
jgi:hypothetical protein